jgi:general secretion pathway protein I
MSANRHTHGYTLIEVLVAMVILAMSLTVLFRIFSTGLNNVGVSADYSRAVLIAETQLAQAGISVSLETGVLDGTVDERFYWMRTVADYAPFVLADADRSPVDAYQVTVAVEWQHSGRSRAISLSSIRLKPAWQPGDST